MSETIRVLGLVNAKPNAVYQAWLASDFHTSVAGGSAQVEPKIGGTFSAQDGTVRGKLIALEPNRKVVQTWRNQDFPKGTKDSQLEVTFESQRFGTVITLLQSQIPLGISTKLEQEWIDRYIVPMRRYFEKQAKKKSTDAAKSSLPSAKKPTVKSKAATPATKTKIKPAKKKPSAKTPPKKKAVKKKK